MRICFIALGKFIHIAPYIDFFKGAGHDVRFVALAPGPPRGVPTYNVGSTLGFLRLPGKCSYLPAMLRARRVVRSLAPDIVHAHYATSAGLTAYVCGLHPYIVTAHGTDVTLGIKSPIWRLLLKTILRNADCVNVVSDGLRNMVLALGADEKRIATLTLGIDTARFQFADRFPRDPAAPLHLICTRQLEAAYDHVTIFKSMAVLQYRKINCRLTIVGDGKLRKPLEALARNLGLEDRIAFAGHVPNAFLPARLAKHAVYLSASVRDGTSLSLLEAMAMGLYPIVSAIKANAALIKHRENGLLHKVSDPENLADCIALLPRESNLITPVLRRNRELVAELGDRTTNMRRLEEIYRHIAMTQGATNHRHLCYARGKS